MKIKNPCKNGDQTHTKKTKMDIFKNDKCPKWVYMEKMFFKLLKHIFV